MLDPEPTHSIIKAGDTQPERPEACGGQEGLLREARGARFLRGDVVALALETSEGLGLKDESRLSL